ncbi:hypothetical protein B0I35DRAFT_471039 [Stachybotrys elegans]|uniref:Lipase B n=1 Tax=Stachybotrys elegans TaxID=80388 RepID=A0A8K0WMT2_9HYPO|nr:hypothetical protein B0I35DRAFT_471039 [Stachybotrys elegans]
MRTSPFFVACLTLASQATARPEPAVKEPTPTFDERGLLDGVVDGVVVNLVKGLLGQVHNALEAGDADAVLKAVKQLVPTARPTNVDGASKVIASLAKARPTNILEYGSHLIANGIISGGVEDLLQIAGGSGPAEAGSSNSNPDPPTSVYPKDACDATYTIPEDKLRAAIYIPDSFTHGEKQPVVLLAGTGNMAYTSFSGNFIPLLSNSDWADPVWVNVPGKLLDDVQTNAEYAAYALNYIASITGRNVSVIGWSQGNIDAQWAFKYWPSTRRVTSDHIAISADYKGSTILSALMPLKLLNTESVLQQGPDTKLIAALRSNGGDSGYVPTTSIYSGFFDEIVQPMSGKEASAYLLDARKVGVTNVEVQQVCAGYPAGTLYTHEGVLYNPLAFALAKDAITHDGPGQVSRIPLKEVCSRYLTPGLGLEELLITENAIVSGGFAMFLYQPKPVQEPKIQGYVTASKAAAECANQ